MKKNIRKQIYELALKEAGLNEQGRSNLVGVSDILDGSEPFLEMHSKVYDWLDKHCSNGHFSRWTSHGQNIAKELDKLLESYYYISNRFFDVG